MAGNRNAMAELRALLTARRPLYQLAHLRIDTSKASAPAAARAITATLTRLPPTAPA
jgi:hypothetical protein